MKEIENSNKYIYLLRKQIEILQGAMIMGLQQVYHIMIGKLYLTQKGIQKAPVNSKKCQKICQIQNKPSFILPTCRHPLTVQI